MSRIKSFSSARQFVALPTSVVQGNYLSAEAGWMLLLCMSYPDEWTYVPRNLWKALPYGRDTVYRSINELIQKGHLIKICHFKKNLKRACDYIFFDSIESCKSFVDTSLSKQTDMAIEVEHKWNFKNASTVHYSRNPESQEIGYNQCEGNSAPESDFHRFPGFQDPEKPDSYKEELYKEGTKIMNQEEDNDSFPINEDFSEFEEEKKSQSYAAPQVTSTPPDSEGISLEAKLIPRESQAVTSVAVSETILKSLESTLELVLRSSELTLEPVLRSPELTLAQATKAAHEKKAIQSPPVAVSPPSPCVAKADVIQRSQEPVNGLAVESLDLSQSYQIRPVIISRWIVTHGLQHVLDTLDLLIESEKTQKIHNREAWMERAFTGKYVELARRKSSNRALAEKLQKQHNLSNIQFNSRYLLNTDNGNDLPYNLPEDIFRTTFYRYFRVQCYET